MKMKFYEIENINENVIVTNINQDNIVKSIYSNMQEIDAETVKKYNLKAGMELKDVFEYDSDLDLYAESVDTYIDDFVIIERLKDDCLYFDNEYDKLYSKKDVENWSEDYIWFFNNSNIKMFKIIYVTEVDVKLTNIDYSCNDYSFYYYKTQKGVVKVKSHPNKLDEVVDGVENLENL